MNLERLAAFVGRHRQTMILFALLSTFAGVALVIDRPKGTVLEWFALPLLVLGGVVFASVVWPAIDLSPRVAPSLASRFIARATLNGRLARLLPMVGVGIILSDLGYNATLSASPSLQTEDTIVILAGIALIVYGFVPKRFSRERDFLLSFFVILNGILVLPLLAARAYYADFERSVDLYSWVAVAPQTSAVLSLLGVANTIHPVVGSTAPGLTFTPQNLPVQVTVVVTTACSGIYSFGIFSSAFVAYVLTEYDTLSRKVWGLLGLGLLTSYVANVMRMVIIVLVGYYTDTAQTDLQNMMIAHSYAGWLIFLGWIALFWSAIFKWIPQRPGEGAQTEPKRASLRGSYCNICEDALSPAISASRCACGAIYHRTCLLRLGHCRSCGDKVRSDTVIDGTSGLAGIRDDGSLPIKANNN